MCNLEWTYQIWSYFIKMPDIQSATSWKVSTYVAICQVANCFRTPVSVKVLKLILLKIIIKCHSFVGFPKSGHH